jgi:hypothetical protein
MLERALNYFIALSFLFFVAGIIDRFGPSESALPGDVAPTSVERALAISRARERGEKTYSFTTNFIPGVGQIADAESYKKAAGLTNPIE